MKLRESFDYKGRRFLKRDKFCSRGLEGERGFSFGNSYREWREEVLLGCYFWEIFAGDGEVFFFFFCSWRYKFCWRGGVLFEA